VTLLIGLLAVLGAVASSLGAKREEPSEEPREVEETYPLGG